MSNRISGVEPPALPFAPKEYDRRYMDQKDNVLRLFFNRLLVLVRALLGKDSGGRFLYFPHANYYSDADQSLSVVNVEQPVTFTDNYFQVGVSVVSSSRLTVTYAGIYTLNAFLQFDKTTASAAEILVWLKKNGTSVAMSAHRYYIAGSSAHLVVAYPFSLELAEDDYVEIVWTADSTDVFLDATAAGSPPPGIASAVVSMTFASNAL